MYICPKTRKPKGLSEVNKLLIDRGMPINNHKHLPPTVCLSLNGTLFYKVNSIDAPRHNDRWLKNAVSVESMEGSHIVIPRPGAVDLLLELEKHTCPMIYSSQSHQFIQEALLQLSISLTNSDNLDENSGYEKSVAYVDHYVWSQDQCISTEQGYKKSLGTLSEFSENGINDIWLIDHRPELVDFPSHVINVSKFSGDPSDTELFQVIDQIFIN